MDSSSTVDISRLSFKNLRGRTWMKRLKKGNNATMALSNSQNSMPTLVQLPSKFPHSATPHLQAKDGIVAAGAPHSWSAVIKSGLGLKMLKVDETQNRERSTARFSTTRFPFSKN